MKLSGLIEELGFLYLRTGIIKPVRNSRKVITFVLTLEEGGFTHLFRHVLYRNGSL